MKVDSSVHEVGALIRELREKRNLSVRALAAKAGFSPSFISQVENGQASPSIASLEKIAACLDVTIGEFFQVREARSSAVFRAEQRPRIESGWSRAEIESFGAGRTSRLDPVLITLRAGGASGRQAHSMAQDQFIFIVSGEVTLLLKGSEHVLTSMDAAMILSNEPFRWVNASGEPAQLLVVSGRAL